LELLKDEIETDLTKWAVGVIEMEQLLGKVDDVRGACFVRT
jgi:hypothetical protein